MLSSRSLGVHNKEGKRKAEERTIIIIWKTHAWRYLGFEHYKLPYACLGRVRKKWKYQPLLTLSGRVVCESDHANECLPRPIRFANLRGERKVLEVLNSFAESESVDNVDKWSIIYASICFIVGFRILFYIALVTKHAGIRK